MRSFLTIGFGAIVSVIGFLCGFVIVLHDAHHLEETVKESQREEESCGGVSGAMQALDFWTRARAYPNADIPGDQYYRSYRLAKFKEQHVPITLTAGSVWDPIGPLNLQGRCLSVAINPLNPQTVQRLK